MKHRKRRLNYHFTSRENQELGQQICEIRSFININANLDMPELTVY
jgi:hypothetical protein